MADQRASAQQAIANGFRDAVCIDAGRVYDSCMDRDCLEDVRVYFNAAGQEAIQNACSCRVKSAEVADVTIDVEPVSFNRGYFACNLTFFFVITCEVVTSPNQCHIDVTGICAFEKKVILCGSEGSVKKFSSKDCGCENDCQRSDSNNLPTCNVEVVDPVVLDSKICEICRCCDPCFTFPCGISRILDGEVCMNGTKALYVTLGLFSIVQLVRNVQMLVPVYDFCIPEKECAVTNDNPCDLFNQLEFPTDEFFPSAAGCNPCSSEC